MDALDLTLASEEMNAERQERQARQALSLQLDIKTVLESQAGLRVMTALLERCHLFDSSFNQDPLVMAALEGERAIGLWLLESGPEECLEEILKLRREEK